MVKRETSLTRISINALEKISKLKNSTGMTSADILDEAFKAYLDKLESVTKRFKNARPVSTEVRKPSTSYAEKLDKDDPAFKNTEAISKLSKLQQPEFFSKLRKQHRAEFKKDIHNNPKFTRLDNTKPPIAYIDACILSLWGKRGIEQIGEAIPAPDYEDYLRPRSAILQWVKQQLEKPIDGTSWAELHKTWYNTHTKYRGRFEKTIDNRVKSLMRSKTIKPSGDRGLYIATRDFTDDENIIIEGILRLQPQKGIVIPKII
jgi:hypothetical protein